MTPTRAPTRTLEPAQIRELASLERFCTVNQVRKIELRDVVANDQIRVDFFNKLLPSREQICFFFELDDLGSDNV